MHSRGIQIQRPLELHTSAASSSNTRLCMTSAQKHLAYFTAALYWDLPPQHQGLSNHVTDTGPTFQDPSHFVTHLSSRDCPHSALSTFLCPSILTLSVVVNNSITSQEYSSLTRPCSFPDLSLPAVLEADKAQLGSRPQFSSQVLVSFPELLAPTSHPGLSLHATDKLCR